jgi:hypothetical protein
LPLIISAVKSNPRRLKRFLNNLNLLQGILVNRKLEVDYKNVLFWSIIDYTVPNLREDLKDNPLILEALKGYINQLKDKIGDTASWDIPKGDMENIPASYHKYLRDRELGNLLIGFDITADQLRQLATMSRIVESAVDVKEKMDEARAPADEFDVMTVIPAGEFVYPDGKEWCSMAALGSRFRMMLGVLYVTELIRATAAIVLGFVASGLKNSFILLLL